MNAGIAEAYQIGGMELALLAILSAVLVFFYKLMREYLNNQKIEREELFKRTDNIQKRADEKAEKRENMLMDHIKKSDENYERIAYNMVEISRDLSIVKSDVIELKNR